MTEITNPPIEIIGGQTWRNEDDDPAIVFTVRHSHRDILRYVIGELGYEAAWHVDDLLKDRKP
jgi:hypothetical protein